jgi:hypothetical protein
MAWFKKNNENEESAPRPRNIKAMLAVRAVAAVYLLYMAYDMVKLYLEDTTEKPDLALVIGGAVFLVAGGIFIGILTYREWRAYQKKEAEEYLASLEAAEAEEASEEEYEEELPEVEVDDDVPEIEGEASEDMEDEPEEESKESEEVSGETE